MPGKQGPFATLELDPRSGIPVYLQLFNQIRRQAVARRLRPGDRLPTVRELAAQLDVNFNTVARAYRLLHRAGLVSAQQGRGTYVLEARGSGDANQVTLQALTSQYIAELIRHGYSPDQIAGVVARQLARRGRPSPAGENHG